MTMPLVIDPGLVTLTDSLGGVGNFTNSGVGSFTNNGPGTFSTREFQLSGVGTVKNNSEAEAWAPDGHRVARD
jgi:hypothetical protein